MNILENVLFQCMTQPRAPALSAPGTGIGLVSYGRLGQMIGAISHRLGQSGIVAGQIVAVAIEDPILEIAVLLTLAGVGAVTVSRYDPQVASVVRIDAIIADKTPSMHVEKVILIDLSWLREAHDRFTVASTSPDALCRIILTSGTTGLPKAVAVSHALLSARIARHITVFGAQVLQDARIFCDAPLATSLGFQFLVFTLWRGGLFVLPGKSFEQTVDAFEEYEVRCCLTSPGGLETLLLWFERYPALQSRMNAIISAGDVLAKSLISRVRSRLCPYLVNVYGSTEASMTATAPVHLIEGMQGAVGFVNPGVEVSIVDDGGAALPPGHQGLLRVRSRFAVDHYYGNPMDSAAFFRDGWFYPGDIGRIEDGVLTIAGRNDSVINLGGDKVSPEAIEAVIAACEGVDECAVFTTTNPLGNKQVSALVVARASIDDAKLRAHCAAILPPHFVPATFFRTDRLPRNPAGKIDRRQLAAVQDAPTRRDPA